MLEPYQPDEGYPYDLSEGLPVPLAISAMLAVQILGATSDEERSRIVHRYAYYIAEAIEERTDASVRLPLRRKP